MRTRSFICILLVFSAVATAAEHGQRTRLQRLTAHGLLRQLDLPALSPQHREPLAGARSRQLPPLDHTRTFASTRTNPGDAVHSVIELAVRRESRSTEGHEFPFAGLDTVYERGGTMGNKCHIYTYDAAGRVTQALTMYCTNQNNEVERTVYTHTPSGLLQSRIVYDPLYADGIRCRACFTYDSEDRLTSARVEWFDQWTGGIQSCSWYTTAFDAQGHTILNQWEARSFQGDLWGFRQESTISDSIEMYTLAELTPTGWLNTSRSILRGNLVAGPLELLEERWNSTRWINQSHCLITFDAQGRIVYSLDEQWKDKDWAPASRSATSYGPDGLSWHSSTELWDGAGWVPGSQMMGSFDEQGRQILQLDESWADGWIPDRKIVRAYSPDGTTRCLDSSWSHGWLHWAVDQTTDPSGRPVISEEKGSSDGMSITGWKQWWTYTPSGSEAEVINARWLQGRWDTVERYLFAYDREDRLHSLKHYATVGEDWVPSAEARSEDGSHLWAGSWSFSAGGNPTMDFTDFTELIFVYRIGLTGVAGETGTLPVVSTLRQNYPNPFNPTTTIPFAVSTGARTTLVIYDVLGREIARPVDEWKDPGEHKVQFDASALASGMYITRFTSGTATQTKRMVLMR